MSFGLIILSALAITVLIPGRSAGIHKSLSVRSDFEYGSSAGLSSSGVDLATLSPEMQMKALHGSSGNSAGRAKYDNLLADGPLGTPTSARSGESLDLQTLSPKAQLNALSRSSRTRSGAAKFDGLISDGPMGTPEHQKPKSKDDSKVKLGSNIGLDGSIHLLRSASQIIAERLGRSRGIKAGVQQPATASIPAPSVTREDRTASTSQVESEPAAYGDASEQSADTGAEARLAAEEAQLRSSVANLEQRAVDTEMSDDQGLLGGPPAGGVSGSGYSGV